jgi:hypothetical protein
MHISEYDSAPKVDILWVDEVIHPLCTKTHLAFPFFLFSFNDKICLFLPSQSALILHLITLQSRPYDYMFGTPTEPKSCMVFSAEELVQASRALSDVLDHDLPQH